MHLGVTDELTTELSQLCHVDVPRQLDVAVQVKINQSLLMSVMQTRLLLHTYRLTVELKRKKLFENGTL